MMTPEDRIEAIEALADFHLNKVLNSYGTGVDVRKILTFGFKGFASFTDKELIDNLLRIRDQHYQSSAILTRIVDSELLK